MEVKRELVLGVLQTLGAFVLAAAVTLAATTARGAEPVLEGAVTDRTTGWAVVGARVTVSAPGAAALVLGTDDQGRFQVDALPCGQVTVAVEAPDYKVWRSGVTIPCDGTAAGALDIELRPDAYVLQDVVVEDRRPDQEPTRRELDRTVVEKLPGFGGDVIKSVQALPGVARPFAYDPGAVVVRGSSQFDTRYFLDGVDIPLLFHYGGLKSTYNSQALSRVDLYPGGFNTRYGGAVGGVIEVTGRPGRVDRWYREADVSLLDASFLAEGPLGDDITVLLNARRSYAGEVADLILSGQNDVNLAVVPYYWDLVGRVDWTPTADDEVFLTFFAAKDRMELVFPDEDLGSTDVSEATDAIDFSLQFHRWILGWNSDLASSLRNELRLGVGTTDQRGNTFGFFRFESTAPVRNVRDQLTWRASDHVVLNGGLDLIWAPVDYDVEVVGYPQSLDAKTFSDLGTYLNAELRPTERLTLIPGLRYDWYEHLDQGSADARLTGRYRLNDRHTLTAAVGSYHQGPQPIGQSTDPVYGNPDLPPTRAVHVVLGDEFQIRPDLHLKAEAYYNVQDDIPFPAGEEGVGFLPDADGRMAGLELMLRYEREGFFGWLACGLSRSERRYARQPSPDLTDWSPSDWVPYELDQPLHVEAVGSWTLGGGWSCGGRLQFVSGNPDTPILGYTSTIYEFDADTGEYVAVNGEYFSTRMDPYLRLDVRVDRAFTAWGADCSAYLDIQNASQPLYDSPEGYVYNYDYSQRKAYGGIILPALGLRVAF
ncbi:MAG TPA: TonB-dependent receptor [Candidatus Krumholzibacteria bacterium]|nr:TonB-dependent receptor [Candidatus Krumholzibacteria bacterium]